MNEFSSDPYYGIALLVPQTSLLEFFQKPSNEERRLYQPRIFHHKNLREGGTTDTTRIEFANHSEDSPAVLSMNIMVKGLLC